MDKSQDDLKQDDALAKFIAEKESLVFLARKRHDEYEKADREGKTKQTITGKPYILSQADRDMRARVAEMARGGLMGVPTASVSRTTEEQHLYQPIRFREDLKHSTTAAANVSQRLEDRLTALPPRERAREVPVAYHSALGDAWRRERLSQRDAYAETEAKKAAREAEKVRIAELERVRAINVAKIEASQARAEAASRLHAQRIPVVVPPSVAQNRKDKEEAIRRESMKRDMEISRKQREVDDKKRAEDMAKYRANQAAIAAEEARKKAAWTAYHKERAEAESRNPRIRNYAQPSVYETMSRDNPKYGNAWTIHDAAGGVLRRM